MIESLLRLILDYAIPIIPKNPNKEIRDHISFIKFCREHTNSDFFPYGRDNEVIKFVVYFKLCEGLNCVIVNNVLDCRIVIHHNKFSPYVCDKTYKNYKNLINNLIHDIKKVIRICFTNYNISTSSKNESTIPY